jgi:hypothetical protein
VPAARPTALRLRWIIWHPQEKLWTWTAVRAVHKVVGDGVVAKGVLGAIVTADSFLLVGRVLARRVRFVAAHRMDAGGGASPRPASPRPKVLYLDCGVHKEGLQIRWMHEWFSTRYDLEILGFEAGSEHIADARSELADVEGVQLEHVALVGPDHVGDEVELYLSGGQSRGKGDSLFSTRGQRSETVPARRLSQVLAERGCSCDTMPVILRMNIEGAEQFVIQDLLDTGLTASVDGYYGMWDDVSKIDPKADKRFRRLLRANGITNVTFNDRDLPYRLRRFAIRTDIATSIRRGLVRVRKADRRPIG